jgi:nucleotide-binding universal stress UspA family protein
MALRYAGAIMRTREAVVLVVWTPAAEMWPLAPVGDAVGRVSGLYDEWDNIAVELAKRDADAGCAIAGKAGLRARPLVAAGKPAETILRIADEEDVEVIVLGAGGRGGIGSLLGSVSARVAHRASRPVLIIPPDASSPGDHDDLEGAAGPAPGHLR